MENFMNGSVPVLVAARVYGKDPAWVRNYVRFINNCMDNFNNSFYTGKNIIDIRNCTYI